MNLTDLARVISSIDEIETWKKATPQISKQERKVVYEQAQRLWLERCYDQNRLYINLNEIKKLEANNWVANDLHKQMIWASVIGSIDNSIAKHRFKSVRDALTKKYGKTWWYQCDKRVKYAYAAKAQMEKMTFPAHSPIHNSMLLSDVSNTMAESILSKIPV